MGLVRVGRRIDLVTDTSGYIGFFVLVHVEVDLLAKSARASDRALVDEQVKGHDIDATAVGTCGTELETS